MSLSLTGKYNLNEVNNLLGKTINSQQIISLEIQKLKDKILNHYLIPLYTKQWSRLNQNLFLCERIKKKMINYYNTYKSEELKAYIDILKVIEILFDKFKNAEKEGGSVNIINGKKSELASIVYKTSMIKLLPEYEVYDSILGKPKKELKEKYNEIVINDIKKLLLLDDIDYDGIKIYIEKNHSSFMKSKM
jgi:hypothetical protein